METHALSTAFALRGAAAALRPAPDRGVPTARPPVGLGGLLPDLTAEMSRAAALDGPKVEANRRVYLPRCMDALGWEQGRQVRVPLRELPLSSWSRPTSSGATSPVISSLLSLLARRAPSPSGKLSYTENLALPDRSLGAPGRGHGEDIRFLGATLSGV